MQTVIIVPICKNKNGDISDAGNYRQACFSCNYHLQVVWALHLSCISPLWPQQTVSLASSQNLAQTCVFFTRLSYYVSKDTPVFAAFW